MKIYQNPDRDTLMAVLQRPAHDLGKTGKIVRPILEKVRRGGDRALKKFALEYDHVELDDLWVSEEEIREEAGLVDPELRSAIEVARNNIWAFHERQREKDLSVEVMPGVTCQRRSVPVEKVGLYIPGGTAPLFSTVLMLGVPARIAGCSEIILTTPSDRLGKINPVMLYTAQLLGIRRILKIGGAHAIAALAYGTGSVPKVDKIFGPGNQYVTMAKQMVAVDQVAIDMPAGPSEVMVVADDDADPSFAAADLLSQAEHGVDSQVILLSRNRNVVDRIMEQVNEQLAQLPRRDIAAAALDHSAAIVVDSRSEMLDVINEYGPEHLILNLRDAEELVPEIRNAGSVFIGAFTPESAGDYASGTNHTLPTNGWAKSFSGVSLDSFVKKITFQKITAEGLEALGPAIERMAEAEHLEGHRNAVTLRLKTLKK